MLEPIDGSSSHRWVRKVRAIEVRLHILEKQTYWFMRNIHFGQLAFFRIKIMKGVHALRGYFGPL